eukprot:1719606-Prymnesium_polylepis.1
MLVVVAPLRTKERAEDDHAGAVQRREERISVVVCVPPGSRRHTMKTRVQLGRTIKKPGRNGLP